MAEGEVTYSSLLLTHNQLLSLFFFSMILHSYANLSPCLFSFGLHISIQLSCSGSWLPLVSHPYLCNCFLSTHSFLADYSLRQLWSFLYLHLRHRLSRTSTHIIIIVTHSVFPLSSYWSFILQLHPLPFISTTSSVLTLAPLPPPSPHVHRIALSDSWDIKLRTS